MKNLSSQSNASRQHQLHGLVQAEQFERFGNGLDTVRTYELLNGHRDRRPRAAVNPFGELEHSNDTLHDQSEVFEYDDLRRLSKATKGSR